MPSAAAKALRELDELFHPELELLADLFDGDPVYGTCTHTVLSSSREAWKAARGLLDQASLEQIIARAVYTHGLSL